MPKGCILKHEYKIARDGRRLQPPNRNILAPLRANFWNDSYDLGGTTYFDAAGPDGRYQHLLVRHARRRQHHAA